MKQILVFILMLSLAACTCHCNETEENSGVTANELANTVTEILAALKPTMDSKQIDFSKAELSISAIQSQTTTGGASAGTEKKLLELEVKLEGELSTESETSVEVSYELKPQVEAIDEVIKVDPDKMPDPNQLLERLPNAKIVKKSIREAIQDARPNRLHEVVRSERNAAIDSVANTRSLYIRDNPDLTDSFVKAIQAAIAEYELIQKQFDTCFAVEISFSIKKTVQGKASIGFKSVGVSGSVARSKEGVHTLKLVFGKC